MKLYYHHVGEEGAQRDFPKTVYGDVPISVVEESTPEPVRGDLVRQLRQRFPLDKFNCWGVPAGAHRVINRLQQGDFVLLAGHMGIFDGYFEALCHIEVYVHYPLPGLSQALWGNEIYPYVFFFRTEPIDLSWAQFKQHLGYKDTYWVAPHFLSVSDEKVQTGFQSMAAYIEYIRGQYGIAKKPFELITESELLLYDDHILASDAPDVEVEMAEIGRYIKNNEPRLTDDIPPSWSQARRKQRDAAFTINVKRLYGASCAICDLRLKTPNGRPEVQSAHIYPKERNGSDDLRNGLCLCRFHHWLFDSGWIAVADDYVILVHDSLPADHQYDDIRKLKGKRLRLPVETSASPASIYLSAHRELHGFT